ncbi:hypothetical protein XAC2852_560049 [Xanthomonas citri pv. citri]|nr:hypothetical protein XAC2852_560049 [Xanthomonas citri pv. citri]
MIDDLAVHGRQARQQAVLRAARNLALIHGPVQILDQGIEVAFADGQVRVRLLHRLGRIRAWAVGDMAELLHQALVEHDDIDAREFIDDAWVVGDAREHGFHQCFDAGLPAKFVVQRLPRLRAGAGARQAQHAEQRPAQPSVHQNATCNER